MGAALSARGLGVRRGARVVLDGVDVVANGGVVAVLGPNGAGKTTLLRCLATVQVPDVGSVHVDGLDALDPVARTLVRSRLGYLPQRVQAPRRATVFDVVDHHAVLCGLDDDRRRRTAVFDALDAVLLRDRASERAGDLSGGLLQRLGIAQAIVARPSLVVLDEPTAGLDPDHRLVVRRVIGALGGRATVVVSTHLIDDVEALAHQVLVLAGGRARWHGTPAALARLAAGRVWEVPPGAPVTASAGAWRSWPRPDGSLRCLGTPPPGVALVAPTGEDGYLLLGAGVA